MLINRATTLMTIALLNVSPERVMSIRPVLVSHNDRLMMAPKYLRIGITLPLSLYHGGHSADDVEGDEGTACLDWNR